MKFSVSWNPAAEKELADLWLNHPQLQREIAEAANRIDSLLQTTPENAGESRVGTVRILLVDPLLVEFNVAAEDLRVNVVAVSLWQRRKG